jgi:putative lipoic acid-binding regulatory protein
MAKTNGKGQKLTPDAFSGKKIEFPVTFQMKAVMTGTENDEVNKVKLEDVFIKQKVEYQYLDKKMSSKGAYTSYTYHITLVDREQMDNMYAALKDIKELNLAI